VSRQAQLVFALAGLWGGAFAWNRAAMPRQERVAQLTFTGSPRATPAPLLVWPVPVGPSADEQRVVRDLFAASRKEPVASPVSTPTGTPAPPPFRYVGFVADGSGRKVLLSTSEGVRAVSEGDLLTGGWKLERVEADHVVIREVITGREAEVPRDP
jgi:hypothetical protein